MWKKCLNHFHFTFLSVGCQLYIWYRTSPFDSTYPLVCSLWNSEPFTWHLIQVRQECAGGAAEPEEMGLCRANATHHKQRSKSKEAWHLVQRNPDKLLFMQFTRLTWVMSLSTHKWKIAPNSLKSLQCWKFPLFLTEPVFPEHYCKYHCNYSKTTPKNVNQPTVKNKHICYSF